MAKLTDYKYRQLRAMVQRAKVRKSVKDLLSCTLRDYKKEASLPEDGTFGPSDGKGEGRCLIGAAVHNIGIHSDWNGIWEEAAMKTFGINGDECDAIINGFDRTIEREDENGWNKSVENPSTQDLAREFGKGNRVAFLANRLRRALLPEA